MGRNFSEELAYRCLNDCKQSGCSGHMMRLISNRSSDVISVEIDGKEEYFFDENVLLTILKLAKTMLDC